MSEHRLYSVAEIATLLGSTPKAVRAMVYRGALPAYRLGGKLYFKWQDIEKALKPVGDKRAGGRGQANHQKEVSP